MKIILHAAHFKSPFGLLCSFLTGSGYSHASIVDNENVHWDTTFKRGYFDKAGLLEPGREVVVIDLPKKDPKAFIKSAIGVRYDVLGLLLWPLSIHKEDAFYCFESVEECLKSVGINLQLGARKSGGKILNGLLTLGYKAETLKGAQVNEWLQV